MRTNLSLFPPITSKKTNNNHCQKDRSYFPLGKVVLSAEISKKNRKFLRNWGVFSLHGDHAVCRLRTMQSADCILSPMQSADCVLCCRLRTMLQTAYYAADCVLCCRLRTMLQTAYYAADCVLCCRLRTMLQTAYYAADCVLCCRLRTMLQTAQVLRLHATYTFS